MLWALLLVGMVGSTLQAGSLPDTFMPINIGTKPVHSSQTPAFCNDLDCPRYTVLETNDQFEKRRYEPSVWVATQGKGTTFTFEKTRMFMKLFHYISGNNSANMKIDMTAPVVTQFNYGACATCDTDYMMHFMMPFHLQDQPPRPTEDGVFIRHLSEFTVYVRTYSEYSTDTIRQRNTQQLVADVKAANGDFATGVSFSAGYDGPYAIDRHNEVWLEAK